MDEPIFYEGQAVGCLMYGEGVISQINSKNTYPIVIKILDEERTYTLDGKILETYIIPTLYPIEQYRAIIANISEPQPEAWQPKPGEWCWFWDDHTTGTARLSKFASYDKEKSSPYLTAKHTRYDNCAPFTGELPEHLKEVQP